MDIDAKVTYDRLIAMWSIQETLLQSYRNIFLFSQSIFFALGVFVTSSLPETPSSDHFVFLFLITVISLITIFRFWMPICKHRGYAVWFWHLQLLLWEKGKILKVLDTKQSEDDIRIQEIDNKSLEEVSLFTTFKNWQKKCTQRRKELIYKDPLTAKILGREEGEKPVTRRKMDIWLPIVLFLLWVVLWIFVGMLWLI